MMRIKQLPLVLCACVACSGSTEEGGESFSTALSATLTDNASGSSSEDSGETTGESTGESKLDLGESDLGMGQEIAEVFGHSGNTLYRLNPNTLETEVVGPFSGCTASIIDIALDADSAMYGTAFGSLWSIDRTTGACTAITEAGSFTTSLSFVPAGTVDPDEEALVGFDDAQYVRIDTATGAVTNLGGVLPGGLVSSGDMVSVIGGGTYLTVRGPDCEDTDCLIEIDPASGAVVRNYGSVGYDEVFGLAFWGGRAYGFAREGVLFEIQFVGNAVISTPIPLPAAPSGLEFYGAGSTTSAPPVEG